MRNQPAKGKRARLVARKARRAERLHAEHPTTVMVTFRHLEPTEALRAYAQRKLAHIGAMLKRACEAHLILSVDKYRQCGEVTVKSGRFSATAVQEAKDLYAVIDLLADKIVHQLKKALEKTKARKNKALSTAEVLSAVEEIRS
jgi:ribosome hibernation promoting factor